jgi:hypothetical protein
MAGGAVGGFIGAFFALPAAAVVQAFLSTWSRRSETVESDRAQVNSPTQGILLTASMRPRSLAARSSLSRRVGAWHRGSP